MELVPGQKKDALYHRIGNNYYQHPAIGKNLRHDQHHLFEGVKTSKPKTLHCTTVKIISDWRITSMDACKHLTTPNQENEDTSIFPNMDPFISRTLKEFRSPLSWNQITQAILKKTCIAVTDGSYDPVSKLATACWVIEGEKSEGRAKGASQTPGNINDKDAYRAELYGI